jgi:nitrite reductase (NADH) large subunit
VYRTFDDLDGIRADALRTAETSPATAGVVVGGSLLVLEAVKAQRQFGLQTNVVEMMPRLMAQQIDEAGGALVPRMVGELSIAVHVDTGTESIESVEHSDGSISVRARLTDGEVIDAGVVIFAAGLTRAERGGALSDVSCQTSDPDIYAIGEVAAIGGRCYGLVGPGYTSAEVVADRVLDGIAEFDEAEHSVIC